MAIPYRPPYTGGWSGRPHYVTTDCANQFDAQATGRVTSVTVNDGGSGYDTATISFTGGGTSPQEATAVAVIVGGVITEIRIVNPGAHYTEIPTVVITEGSTGSGASATAVVTGPALIENTTEVNLLDGGCVDTTLDGLPVATYVSCCGNGLAGGYGEANILTRDDYEYNEYTPSTTKFADYADCVKVGWKAVQARKAWHGRYGFRLAYGESVAIPVKYTTVTSTLSYSIDSGSLTQTGSASIDSTSGKISYSGFEQTVSDPAPPTNFWFGCDDYGAQFTELDDMVGWLFSVVNNGLSGGSSALYFNADKDCANTVVVEAVLNTGEAYSSLDPEAEGNPAYTTIERDEGFNWTDTNIAFGLTIKEWTYFEGTGYEVTSETNATVDITLGGAVTAEALLATAFGMLGQWDLTNDNVYPWRTDDDTSTNPIVIYDEVVPSSTIAGGTMSTCGGGMCNVEGDPPSCDDCSTKTGALLGVPLPEGTGKHFQFDHRNYTGVTQTSCGDWNKDTTSEGNAGIPACAPRWTDLNEGGFTNGASVYYNAASGVLWVQKWAEILQPRPSFNFFRLCGEDRHADVTYAGASGSDTDISIGVKMPWLQNGDTVKVEGVDSGSGLPDGEYTISSVADQFFKIAGHVIDSWTAGGSIYGPGWAVCGRVAITAASNESPIAITVQTAQPYLRTGDTVDITGVLGNTAANVTDNAVTRIDDTHFTLDGTTGNGAYTGGGQLTGRNNLGDAAPAYYWHDSDSKGDYVTFTASYESGGNISTGTDVCTQRRHDWSPCEPAVACYSPNEEAKPMWQTFGLGSVSFNTEPTVQLKWVGRIFGSVVDPYARNPGAVQVEEIVEAVVDGESNYVEFGAGLGAGAGQNENPEHVTGLFPCSNYQSDIEDSAWEEWTP